jgi:hypothetical protein
MKWTGIDRLSQAELIDLNHRIVERFRFLAQIHAHVQMLKFRIGGRVCFRAGRPRLAESNFTPPPRRRSLYIPRLKALFRKRRQRQASNAWPVIAVLRAQVIQYETKRLRPP